MAKNISVMIDGEEQGKNKKEFSKYEVEDAIRAIMSAEDVLENKALMKEVKRKLEQANKKVGSISDIRKLAEKPNFGLEDALEDVAEMDKGDTKTPDDKAEESNEKRVKNSKNPTIVGKTMK